jgi:hypothetical protein
MIKYFLLFFLSSAAVLHANVQFGAKLGYNLSQHYGVKEKNDEYAVQSSFRHGLTAGFFVYLPITKNFGMQYESNYVQKGSYELITLNKLYNEPLETPLKLDVLYETDYWELPILFSYHFPITQKLGYHAYSGTAMSLLLKNYYQLDGIWQDEDGIVTMKARERNFSMEQFDFSFVYGGEIHYKWSEWNLVFGYRFTLGWNSLKMPTYAYLPIEGESEPFFINNLPVELKNQAYAFTLGIVF